MRETTAATLVGADLQFSVLGALEARRGSATIELGAPKQRSVLAMLLAHPNQPLSVGRIISAVWGEEAPETYRRSIHTYVSNLRALLGTEITRVGDGYRLDVRPEQIDALVFQQTLEDSQILIATAPGEASIKLREALAMWRSRPYTDLYEVEGLQAEVQRLEELRLTAVELRFDAELASGRHQQIVPEVGALAEEHPLRERFRAQHMIALYRSGRQAAALGAYERTRDYLAEELGLEPSQNLQDLELAILRQDEDLNRVTGWTTTQRLAFLAAEVEDLDEAWDRDPQATADALATLDRILGEAVAAAGGRLFRQAGERSLAAFPDVSSAVDAAERSQRDLAEADWGTLGDLHVGMAIDIGEAETRGENFQGPPVTRASRLASTANGGQVLVSGAVHTEIAASPVVGLQVRHLGDHELAGFATPERVGQLVFDGLPSEFPDLRPTAETQKGLGSGGLSLPGYEIREKIGDGALGVVYRAYQPSVGREVAIKVIRAQLANHPRFIHRFEAEARTVARLAHPRIVPLIDFWRDSHGAYLVLQLLKGGSLEEAIRQGPIDQASARNVLHHVGEALDHAHSQGIFHGDLRPANILLDASGNAYLSDFDITARLLDSEIVEVVSESSEFRAPEVSSTGLTAAADIYALGRISRLLMDDLAISEILDRATATNPSHRYPSAASFLTELDRALGREPEVGRPPVSRNPYKGLRAFEEADARDFHGRDELVGKLVKAVRNHRFVTVVGPSGSGKSSVVRAGLLPALMNGAIDGSTRWFHTVITPGVRPTESLDSSLAALASVPARAGLTLADEGLHATAERLLDDSDGELLVVIDQLEEVFTVARDPTERRDFIDLLADAVEREDTRVRVVATLRADLYDRPLSDERLGRHLRDGQVTVLRPTRDELVDMIVSPSEAAGLNWEPGLVGRIVQEVADRPGGLPLLQYALTELVENRRSNILDSEDYERIGGVAGALAGQAETVYDQLPPRLQKMARDIMLRLVTVDEDTRDIRRRVRLSELESLDVAKADLDRILTPFVTERLLLADRDPATRGPTVEVAHEALLREWPRLRTWIDEEREALIVTRRLQVALQEWETADRDPGYLLTGSRLVSFQNLLESTYLASEERAFLEASLEQDRAAGAARRRRRRILTGVLVGVTGIAVVLAGLAFTQGRRAAAEAERATTNASLASARELAASAINVLDQDPELSVLLATEAATLAEPGFETVSALHEALYHDRLLWTVQWSGDSSFFTGALSPDGTKLALTGIGRMEVWDVEEGNLLWSIDLPADLQVTPFFSQDGDEIVGLVGWPRLAPLWGAPPSDAEPGIYTWDATTGNQLGRALGGECPIWDIGHFGPNIDLEVPVLVAGFTERVLGSGCDHDSGTVSLLEIESGRMTHVADIDPTDYRSGLSTSKDARYVAFTENKFAHVIDTATGEEMAQSPVTVFSATLSPDGSRAVLREDDGVLSILDFENDLSVRLLDDARGERVQFEEEGTRFAHYDFSGNIEIFDVVSTKEVGSLIGGPGRAARMVMGAPTTSYSSDGTRLASFAGDGSARVWSTAPLGEVGSFPVGTGMITAGSVTLREDRGSLLVYPDHPKGGSAVVFDPGSGETIARIDHRAGQTVALSADGTRLATQRSDTEGVIGLVEIHDLESGSVMEMEGLCTWPISDVGDPQPPCVPSPETPFQDWARDLEFSPDGSLLALSGGISGSISVWDSSSGRMLFNSDRLMPPTENDPHNDGPTIAFDPDGARLVVSTRDELLVYDTPTWSVAERTPMERMTRFAFTPDGEHLIGATPDMSLLVIDTATWELIRSLRGHRGHIHDLGVSPDSSMIASSDVSGLVRIWDLETGSPLQAMSLDEQSVQNVEFLNSSHLLVTPQTGPNALILTIDVDELVDIARSRVTRGFTTEECQTYLHLDACPSG
ncbi:MAG TPA: BTAD domain-containing putative transcriptional regulator [Acidimicrobiia bacterium]|nr:BTAD domain-containing putative transcriptional regulator [Acidimicrobiia bacterium]